jgi:glycosyltransferase involved in cell wall biosynthesis
MKRILIFHPYLAPYRIDLYNRLSEIYTIKVILTGRQKELDSLGFDLKHINSLANFNFKYINKGIYIGRHLISLVYAKIIQEFKPDIVIGHELGINTIISAFLKSVYKFKLFSTIDDSPNMIRNYGRVRNELRKFIVANCESMFFVNPECVGFMVSKFKNSKCNFVYFPIIQDENLLQSKFTNANIKQIFNKYNISDKVIILFVGRLESQKSPELLLSAFSKLNDNSCVLIFVGNGKLFNQLNEQVNSYNLQKNVIFTGRLTGSELYSWFSLSDIFALPSNFEPFGAVVNEALVAGCQVIVSDKVGANCLINSTNGVIFQAGNEDELVNSLKSEVIKFTKKEKGELRLSKMPISFQLLISTFKNCIESTK